MNQAKAHPKDVFFAALECRSPAELARFLDEACGDDRTLRIRVDELLTAHESAGRFLAGGDENEHCDDLTLPSGGQVGPYRLVERLGEGGMGVVYRAEQSSPVQRTVALKVVKPGMDTRQVIARFEAERQALAMMDHPNIAKVLDAGTIGGESRVKSQEPSAETGTSQALDSRLSALDSSPDRPFFVMELVNGIPITTYCDAHQFSLRARLELLVPVCRAVQHAHQKGIIHRDIKPTNVLVAEYDGQPCPKIIDFGVAKATAPLLSERTKSTESGQLIGTIEYMSPEQAKFSQLDVDTRSDIYSLGVLLYELLTGDTPIEKKRLETVAFDETLRMIREEEPPKPSRRLSSLAMNCAASAASRRTEPARLSKEVRGELDWIVMKALEKDRNDRYETAAALADDIQRYLNNEPVTAAAPSPLYRFGKFVRRNKWPVTAAAALLLGLIAMVVGTSIGLVSQSRQRATAERERAEAQLNLAGALQSQRKYADAERLYRQAIEIPVGDTSTDRQRVARTRLRLAELVADQHGAAASERLHREALAAFRAAFPSDDTNIAQALNNLAFLLRAQLRFEEAELLFREAYEIHRRAVPVDHRSIGESATNLANVLVTRGKYAEAEALAREAVANHQRSIPRDEFALAFTRLELGRVLIALGKFSEAEPLLAAAEHELRTTDFFHVGALALATLYTEWERAEPGQGHDAQAKEWIGNLMGTFNPTTNRGQSTPAQQGTKP